MKNLKKGLWRIGVLCMAAVSVAANSGGVTGVAFAEEAAEPSLTREPEMSTGRTDPVKLPIETWTADSGEQYTGMELDGNIQGYGKVVYPNGNSYEGYFKADTSEKHKYGVFSWGEEAYNGWYYEGNFSGDVREGYGIAYDSSGLQYAGEYENDKRDGYGVAFLADGTAAQAGVWKNGEFAEDEDIETWTDDSGNQWYGTRNSEGNLEGKGICLTADGTCRIGSFGSDGLMYAKGFEYTGDSFYIGNFSGGEKDGYGILRLVKDNIWQEGNFADGSLTGYGISRYSTGWYEGEWADGTVDGMGIRFLADGSLDCAGEWKMGKFQEDSGLESWTDQAGNWYTGKKDSDGLLQGEGIKILENGSRYMGNYRAGVLQVRGAAFYTAGNWYGGEWKDGQINGYGRYHYTGGTVLFYEGNWVLGNRKGYGAIEWIDGERFEGEWDNHLRNGLGIDFGRDGNIIHAGVWADGQYQEDSGLEDWTDGSGNRYFGVRNQEGNIEGKGIRIYSNGNRYIGSFVNGSREDYGICYYADGAFSEGELKDGKFDGAHARHNADGQWIVGLRKDGTWNGAAIWVAPDGGYLCMRMKDGDRYGYWTNMGRYHDISLGFEGEGAGAGETWTDGIYTYIGFKNEEGQIDGEGASISSTGNGFIGKYEAGAEGEGATFYYATSPNQSYFFEGTKKEEDGDTLWNGILVYFDSESGRIAKTIYS